MTEAMILVTMKCQQAGMRKSELEWIVDPWRLIAFCLGVLTEKVNVGSEPPDVSEERRNFV
jgi:hypothetical protein